MNKYLSDKIRILSFISILLVVLLHNQMLEYSTGMNHTFQLLITEEITRAAVPLFFTISGTLLFYNCKQFGLNWYCKKIESRVKSLMIPFLAWSFFGFCIVYSIKLLNPSFFSSAQPITDYSIYDYIATLLWHPVGTYQLWFIRDLMICVILSPFIYYALKYIGMLFLAVLGLLWALSIQWVISIESLMFVSLGSYIALYKKEIVECICHSKAKTLIYSGIFLCACITDMYFPIGYLMHCIVIISGMLSLWYLYDIFFDDFFCKLKDSILIRYTFFIYAFHEPLLTFIKGFCLRISEGQWGVFMSYIISPILTLVLSFIAGYIFKKRKPHLYSIVCGGR